MNLPDPSSDRRRLALFGLAFWSFAVAIWLALLAPRMAPVRRGTPEGFWEIACGIELSPPANEWGGHILYDEGGWLVYDEAGLHGSDAFYVPVEEALVRLGDALFEVEKVRRSGLRSPAVEAVEKWQAGGGRTSGDLKALVQELHAAWRQRFLEKRPDLLPNYAGDQQVLVARWDRMKVYWATLLFEWLFFTVLGAIAIRPLARGLGPVGWSLHFAAIPPLFMLPVFLGYSAHSFTGSIQGGVLYPWVHFDSTMHFHRAFGSPSHSALDVWIREHLPQLLEPLSCPVRFYFPAPCEGMPGPTETVVIGALFGVTAGACRWGIPKCHYFTAMLRPPNPS